MLSFTLEIVHRLADSALAPALIFIALLAVSLALRLYRLRLPWLFLSTAMTLVMLMVSTAYLFLPVLFEDAETNIACIAALAMRGLPVFPAPDATARYILLYGPLTYLAHIPFYLVFGENLFSFKFLGVLAFFVSMSGTYRICRKYAQPRPALIGLGCASLVFFRYMGVEFWGRIDPVILAVVVVSIWAILEAPVWAVIAITALTVAVIPNLKATGVTYLIPVLALLAIRKGWNVAGLSALIGAILFPLPFLLPQVSFSNYVFALGAAAQHGIVSEFLIRNLQYTILWLAPVIAVAFGSDRRPSRGQTIYFASIAGSLLITCFLGAKSGAGSYHLIPFAIPLLHQYFWIRNLVSEDAPDGAFLRFALPWTMTMLILSSAHVGTTLREFRGAARGGRIIAEVRQAESTYRGRTIEVGIGDEFRDMRTRYGFLTTFDGQSYTISGAAIRDLQFGGVDIPDSTIRYIEACGTQVWLIPSGRQPFSAANTYYDKYHSGFDEKFRQAFLSHYAKSASGKLFDVWTCNQR